MQVPQALAASPPSRSVRESLTRNVTLVVRARLHRLTCERIDGLEAARGASFTVSGPFGDIRTTVVTPSPERAAPLFFRREISVAHASIDTAYLVAGAGDRLEGARLLEQWREGARFFVGPAEWIRSISAPSSGTRFGHTRYDLFAHYRTLLWTSTVRGDASARGALFRTARDAFLAHDPASRAVEAIFGRSAMVKATRGLFD